GAGSEAPGPCASSEPEETTCSGMSAMGSVVCETPGRPGTGDEVARGCGEEASNSVGRTDPGAYSASLLAGGPTRGRADSNPLVRANMNIAWLISASGSVPID